MHVWVAYQEDTAMPRPRRSAIRKPARRRAAIDSQLAFDFAPGASAKPAVEPPRLQPKLTARALERLAHEPDDELLAAAVQRVRARSIEWNPPLHSLEPKALMGRRIAKAGREKNDAALEWAGMEMMGYRRH
jgi:hypothetical protein